MFPPLNVRIVKYPVAAIPLVAPLPVPSCNDEYEFSSIFTPAKTTVVYVEFTSSNLMSAMAVIVVRPVIVMTALSVTVPAEVNVKLIPIEKAPVRTDEVKLISPAESFTVTSLLALMAIELNALLVLGRLTVVAVIANRPPTVTAALAPSVTAPLERRVSVPVTFVVSRSFVPASLSRIVAVPACNSRSPKCDPVWLRSIV